MGLKVVECKDRDKFIEHGINEVKKLLENYGENAASLMCIVVDNKGQTGYHFTHTTGMSRLAMLGSLEEAKHRIQQRLDEVN